MGITRCDKCHTYPGSILCKTDTVQVHGIQATQCFKCHNDAVNVDSSWDEASKTFVYHDKMISNNGSFIQSTGPQHANGKKTMNFSQCTQCHSFPPSSGKHSVHVIDNGKECLDCHFGTVKYDTAGEGTERYLRQLAIKVPGGASLPLLDSLHHINNKIDVIFEKNSDFERKAEITGNDTIYPYPLFRFNPNDKSCSSIECHSGTEFGGAPIDRSIWEETVK
jgi:predicted CxxxxCH...CXXCH cytochrome family protein